MSSKTAIIFASQVRPVNGLLLIMVIVLLFWTLVIASDSLAEGFEQDSAWRKTVSITWQHYEPLGHLDFSLRTDNQLRSIRSFGAGHYFDRWDFGLSLSGNRSTEEERYKLGYSMVKKFLDNYTFAVNYQPVGNELRYAFNSFQMVKYLRFIINQESTPRVFDEYTSGSIILKHHRSMIEFY